MIVSKTSNAPGWATKTDNLIPNGVKCNENVIWVSVLRLVYMVVGRCRDNAQNTQYINNIAYMVHLFIVTVHRVPQFKDSNFYLKNWNTLKKVNN